MLIVREFPKVMVDLKSTDEGLTTKKDETTGWRYETTG
jgi:hypothetical protein